MVLFALKYAMVFFGERVVLGVIEIDLCGVDALLQLLVFNRVRWMLGGLLSEPLEAPGSFLTLFV